MVTRPGDKDDSFKRQTGISGDDFALLASVPLFANLRGEDVRALLKDAWIQQFPRGATLFTEGEPAHRFYVIMEGWVKLCRQTADGHESVIAVFSRGESFAEAAIFDSALYPVTAIIAERARLIVVPAASFVSEVCQNCSYSLNMMAAMSRHMRYLVAQLEQRTLRSTTERVVEFLLRLCSQESGRTTVRLPSDKALIASRLGMQPETFSRTLAKLRKFGVTTNGSEITIPDIVTLQSLGDASARDSRYPGPMR